MFSIKRIFLPDRERYEGVRPINIYFLRALYLLMFVGVGIETWGRLIGHEGPWDHTKAVAVAVWAAYPTLGLLGLLQPLRWLPIVIFMIFYKTIWIAFVAYPLWRGSPCRKPCTGNGRGLYLGAVSCRHRPVGICLAKDDPERLRGSAKEGFYRPAFCLHGQTITAHGTNRGRIAAGDEGVGRFSSLGPDRSRN